MLRSTIIFTTPCPSAIMDLNPLMDYHQIIPDQISLVVLPISCLFIPIVAHGALKYDVSYMWICGGSNYLSQQQYQP